MSNLLRFKVLFGDDNLDSLKSLVIIVSLILIIALVVARQLSVRNIPFQQYESSRQETFSSFPANDILILTFSTWFLSLPALYVGLNIYHISLIYNLAEILSPENASSWLIYMVFTVLIAYISYRINIYKPKMLVTQPIREKPETFIRVYKLLALLAAMSLGLIAVIPDLLIKWIHVHPGIAYLMGGRDMIIMVGAALSVAHSIQRHRKSLDERTS